MPETVDVDTSSEAIKRMDDARAAVAKFDLEEDDAG